ncbi:MAG: HlyD family type I secretion periplasmic adaptor subunit [Paracoccaceae bacterium]
MSNVQHYRGHHEMMNSVSYERAERATPEPHIRGFVVLGLLCLVFFFGGAVYWAYKAKLDGAVFAEASLVVDGNRKSVQHLDGGIVRALLVGDGDPVVAGQSLLTLDSTELDVTLDVLSSQAGDLTIRRARLLAQIDDAEAFSRPDVTSLLGGVLPEKHWLTAYLTQKDLFDSELRARKVEEELLAQRMENLRQEVQGLQEQRDSNSRQAKISEEELESLDRLFRKGLVTGNRVSAIKSEIERLRGIDASLKTAQARARNEIGQIKLTGLSQKRLRTEAIATELAGIEAQLTEIGPQLSGALERRNRVEIKAPVSGRVVNLEVFTTGGVIRPGQSILEIVPDGEDLIVEAQVKTSDIESLEVGQTARLQLTAFQQEDVPEATGRIAQISADSLKDDRTGDEFFMVRVHLDERQSPKVATLDLLPGMPVGLFVNTGARTALSYLTQPLRDRLRRTFIE